MTLVESIAIRVTSKYLVMISTLIWLALGVVLALTFNWADDREENNRHELIFEGKTVAISYSELLNQIESAIAKQATLFNYHHSDIVRSQTILTDMLNHTVQGSYAGVVIVNSLSNQSQSWLLEETGTIVSQEQIPGFATLENRAMKGAKKEWLLPVFDTYQNQWFIHYVTPLELRRDNNQDHQKRGLAFITFSLKTLSNALLTTSLENEGFPFLISRNGQLLAFPDEHLLGQYLSEVNGKQRPLLQAIAEKRSQGILGKFRHPVTNKDHWVVTHSLPNLDAQLGVIISAESLEPQGAYAPLASEVCLFLLISGLFTSLATIKFPDNRERRVSRVYAVLSLILFSYLLLLWYQALEPKPLNKGETLLIDKESTVMAMLRNQTGHDDLSEKDAQHITLSITAIDLEEADLVNIVGDAIVRGAEGDIPPIQINNAVETEWSLSSEKDHYQIWHFVANIKQPFDYESFPFDREVIELSFLPSVASQYETLEPRFEDYTSLKPEQLPGIEMREKEFGGWHILQTYFSYLVEPLPDNESLTHLKYNVVIQRSITGPLISHIMPLFVVSFLTYFMLLLWTKDEKQQSLWGFNTATALQYCASLFFILIIAHVALREELNAQGVIFIEYFYFLAYLQIIFTAIGALAYTTGFNLPSVEYKNGLLVKQLYWPSILALSLVVTVLFIEW